MEDEAVKFDFMWSAFVPDWLGTLIGIVIAAVVILGFFGAGCWAKEWSSD